MALTGFHLLAGKIEADLGGALELTCRTQRSGIVLQRVQCVRDILQRADEHRPVSPCRLIIVGLGLASLMQQRAGIKNSLGDVAGEKAKCVDGMSRPARLIAV